MLLMDTTQFNLLQPTFHEHNSGSALGLKMKNQVLHFLSPSLESRIETYYNIHNTLLEEL